MTTAAAANDKFGLDQRRVHDASIDEFDEIFDETFASPSGVLTNRREWRVVITRRDDVIETNDRHILGNANSMIHQRADHADGYEIAGGNHGIERLS
jgi:hypothetical protein